MSHSPGWWPVQNVEVPRSPSLLYWRRLQGLILKGVLAQHHSDFWPTPDSCLGYYPLHLNFPDCLFSLTTFHYKIQIFRVCICVTACTRTHLYRYLGSEVEFRLWATKVTHMIETVVLKNIFKLDKIFHENYYLKILLWKAEFSPSPFHTLLLIFLALWKLLSSPVVLKVWSLDQQYEEWERERNATC